MLDYFKIIEETDKEERPRNNTLPTFFLSESYMTYLENMYKSWSFTVNKYYTVPEWVWDTSNG